MTSGEYFYRAVRTMPDHIWSSEPDVSSLLSGVIEATKASVVVETGVWHGKTSISLVKSLSELGGDDVRHYTGIDIVDCRTPEVSEYMTNSGVRCKMILGSSIDELKKLPKRWADLIFIDSVHEFDYLRDEFRAAEAVIKQNGIIALHDSIHVKGVYDWVQYLKTMNWFEVINMQTSEGRGLALVKCLCV